MAKTTTRIRVTVVKRLSKKDIFGDDPPLVSRSNHTCTRFEDGQEFVVDDSAVPAGFCPWAYADIQRDITHLRLGGDFPWMEQKGTMLSCCTDGNRPVIFKLERIDE